MKKSFSSFLILLIPSLISSAQIPSSSRSIKAVQQKTPVVEKLFDGKGLLMGSPVFIRIFKETKELEVWIKDQDQFKLLKTYAMCNYSGTLGTKTRKGDEQAPEGFYKIMPASLNPSSDYHLSFNIGYPNAYDRSHHYTGSAIMVHGDCVSIGCFAMGNDNIEEIWTILVKAFEKGQPTIPLHIFPFRMTTARLEQETLNPWLPFWNNLKEGYDLFEKNHTVPHVSVKNGRYVF